MIYAILMKIPYPVSSLLLRAWKEGATDPLYEKTVTVVKQVIHAIERSPYSALYQLLYRGKVLTCEEKEEKENVPCIREMNVAFLDTAQDGHYYSCLYHSNGNIGHYFVLIRQDGRWYLSSSYGSEWVRVPLRTQEVPVEDLRMALEAIENKNDTALEPFFRRYFLDGGLRMLYSDSQYEATPALKGKVIPHELGVRRELDIVLTSGHTLHMGFIEHMEEHVGMMVRDILPLVGGRFRRRNTLTRRGKGARRGRKRERRVRTRRRQ
jgi:hypothetical protein